MGVRIEAVSGEEPLTELVTFADKVYEYRSARWPALVPLLLPILLGDSPMAERREFHPLLARDGDEIVARAVPAIDRRYIEHWGEQLGHIVMFEAMPDTDDAVKLLMDEASEWLRERGMTAARSGFGPLEFPFAIDQYDVLPPNQLRQNPTYYHRLLKEAQFESEKGWVDYKIEVTPELVERWERMLQAAPERGFEIIPLRDVPEDRRMAEFADTWNDAFKSHWGASPFSREEASMFAITLEPFGMLDLSVLAYRNDEPVGVLWVAQETSAFAVLSPGRELHDSEKLNFLGIGVRENARGQGVNLAMSAYAYLELVRRGAKYLSYTLVLDDNWPSRRTAEKLGARICANYMVYRRNFR
jgi:GNAT superfamily N-acetyltransferase